MFLNVTAMGKFIVKFLNLHLYIIDSYVQMIRNPSVFWCQKISSDDFSTNFSLEIETLEIETA